MPWIGSRSHWRHTIDTLPTKQTLTRQVATLDRRWDKYLGSYVKLCTVVSLENHATTEQYYNTADLTCLESKEQAETHLEKLRAPTEIINRMEAVWSMPLSCWSRPWWLLRETSTMLQKTSHRKASHIQRPNGEFGEDTGPGSQPYLWAGHTGSWQVWGLQGQPAITEQGFDRQGWEVWSQSS